jgi:hypothetical protein
MGCNAGALKCQLSLNTQAYYAGIAETHTFLCGFSYNRCDKIATHGLVILLYFVRCLNQVMSETVDKIEICSSRSDYFSKVLFEYLFSSSLSRDLPPIVAGKYSIYRIPALAHALSCA